MSKLYDTQVACGNRIAQLERELAEAREQRDDARMRWHDEHLALEAAEARLAAVARVLRGPYIELTQRELVALLDEARAALDAPAERARCTVIVQGTDPGASAGHCVLADGRVAWLDAHAPNPAMHIDVLAVEGQRIYKARVVSHKGEKFAVNPAGILTLAFHAGLLAGRSHRYARVLRMAPDVWRALLWADSHQLHTTKLPDGTVLCPWIGRLRRDLLASAAVDGHAGRPGLSDDCVEAYGLARAGAVVGLERKGVTPAGLAWVAEPQPSAADVAAGRGWWDVRIPKPKATRPHTAKRRTP